MEATTSLNIRVNAKNKKEATKILADLGLNMTTAVNMFLAQVVKSDGIPFEIRNPKPSKELIEAIKEGEQIADDIKCGRRNGYSNMEDFIESLERE